MRTIKTSNGILKAIVMDVDGTLTDGKLHISKEGEVFKSFYSKDGIGILSLHEYGIKPIILTSRDSKIVKERAKELNITEVIQGAKNNKKDILEEYMHKNNLKKENMAYIGDDINDLESMKLCEIIGCPNDSVNEVKDIAQFVSSKDGGNGAVRDFIDYLIKGQ